MHHYISHFSLIGGWLPSAVQVFTVVVLMCALDWRSRRSRITWFPLSLLLGVASTVAAHAYIASIGVAGDPAPDALWIWTGLSGASVGLLLSGGRVVRWWRRGLSVLAVPLCLLCAALALNDWVGYFPTVHSAWNQLTAGPLPNQTDRLEVTAMQLAGVRPERGVIVPVTIDAASSQFPHRKEFVYLPPSWFATNPPPRLPTVMMIGSALNTPADWLRAGDAVTTVDDFASAHQGNAPVLVFVDPTGAFDNDTECVDGPRGNAASHLIKDVVPYVVSHFGVSPDQNRWGIAGWSMGGTCAVDLAAMHPNLFHSFVDIAGDLRPNTGSKEQTIARLFGGSSDRWASYDPTTVIDTHGRYEGMSGLFEIADNSPGRPRPPISASAGTITKAGGNSVGNPEGQDTAARELASVANRNGINCAIVARPGRHDWPFAARAFANTLPWLAAQLLTPGVPQTAFPDPQVAVPSVATQASQR